MIQQTASTSRLFRLTLPTLASRAVVLAIVLAGGWFIAYGLPTGETASWWVFIGALLLLAGAVAAWRYVDLRRMSLLQRCLIVSVLLHVLIAAAFSGMVVARQVARIMGREDAMAPTVNLNLSQEMQVRTQLRQEIADTPALEAPTFAARPVLDSPLPPLTNRIEPIGTPGIEPRQLAAAQNAIAPTILAPPAVELAVPLAPVSPTLAPVRETTPLPLPADATAADRTHLSGPLIEQLVPAATPIPAGSGVATGALGAPPASLSVGTRSGGTASGSGTGRPFSTLQVPTPAAPIVPVFTPPPSGPDIAMASSADPLPVRSFEQRERLLDKYGGSPETEAAVARALLYLSRVQHTDGRWSKIDAQDAGKDTAHDTALTALAVLCYLAANHTPDQPGPYQDTVKRGVNFLLASQRASGDLRLPGGNMYDQGIATLALGEAAAMNKGKDKALRAAAHRGATFILDAQNKTGAWRYEPRDLFTDTSVTGWEVMALHSAERTGLAVDPDSKLRVLRFLTTVTDKDLLSRYMSVGYSATAAMTAEALFTRMLLNQPLTPEELVAPINFILTKSPTRENLNYYNVYYSSLALMQVQGDAWKQWNAGTSKLLVGLQERTGADAGSFPADKEWSDRGGRIYNTTLSTLTLEVYYRYLPMYAGKK